MLTWSDLLGGTMTFVEIRLLGSVAVERNGVAESRRSRNHAALLAMLALNAGRAVDGDVLIDEAWGEDLPQNPRGTLQIALTRLRAWLGERAEPWLTARAGLYTLHLPPDAVDLLRFLRLADAALTSDDIARYDEARDAWRGTPFPGLDSDRLAEARRTAEQRRRTLTVRHAALLLDAGRPGEVVDLLAGEDRLDEEFATHLVRALREGGRHRDAVETFLDVRRRLRDELGVEPGPVLRSTYATLTPRHPRPAPARGPEIVGRAAVVAPILQALHEDGRVVVLHGRAGAGKTAVLRAVLSGARDRGARTAASAWGENGAPAAPWHEVIDDLGVRSAVPDRDLGPWVHEQLARSAQDAPLLVALDDAHRADTASLDVLRVLARRGLPPGVVVVVAARSPDSTEHPHWDRALAELGTQHGVTTCPVGALAPDAVATLVRRRLAALDPGDDLAAAVLDRSGGLALHVTALLDLLGRCTTRAEAAQAITEVPEQVRAVVEHQAAQLPALTRRAIEALAVLRPIDLTSLAAVLARRPLDLADDLEVAVRAGLVTGEGDRYVLRHDLDADGLRDGVSRVRAAHLHLARLDALDDAADVFTVLRHAEGAASLLPPLRVATARVDAGVESYRRRALPEASALFEAALPAAADDVRARLLAYRALCLSALGGDADDPDDALDEALDAALAVGDDELAVLVAIGDEPLGLSVQGDPRRYGRLCRLLGRPLGPRPRFDLVVATIREAEATAQDAAPELMAEALALADDLARVDPHAHARVRTLEARSLVDGSRPALDRLAIAADAHRLAVATEDPALFLDATELLMSAELTAGHSERAHKLRVELETAGERWFRPRSIWAAQVTEAAMLLAEGDPGADAAAERAAERGGALGLPGAPLAAGAHLLVKRVLGGGVAELAPLAAHASAQSPNTAAWAAAAAFAETCAGHDDEARVHLAEFSRRTVNPAMWFGPAARAVAAAAAFNLRDTAVAAHVREVVPADPDSAVLVGFGGAVLGPVPLWTGLAAWTLDDVEAARRDLTAAAAFADRAGWPPWSAAARQCLTALDDPSAPLPLGLHR
ncbi:BTAD domain-containing putative transcriptional regulator [Actinomycetospora sp. TBRC 11914]|uniref:BTAD domain-containing putative transcriptional regulator n=1 Tax=Actinomycetospora sp. TBRC 11914 TaxID=2729387 RepID=UPI00145DD017|nr:BTAD domain-containing putative transcriptional regulator [Actinomycetospora sp. TBRC 11914]NMO90346.1 AAA family ATPase [Actinomycetospora sp. TBRC 11914]